MRLAVLYRPDILYPTASIGRPSRCSTCRCNSYAGPRKDGRVTNATTLLMNPEGQTTTRSGHARAGLQSGALPTRRADPDGPSGLQFGLGGQARLVSRRKNVFVRLIGLTCRRTPKSASGFVYITARPLAHSPSPRPQPSRLARALNRHRHALHLPATRTQL